ncbi:MAG: NRDE family protein [Magnetovibrio sp.]|nr:NRDE family protein [Magnetovibrio sp.]
MILRRSNHTWPLLIGANRDENGTRPWAAPARHWDDRADVVAGLDELAGGTWLGINDFGLVACVLNRPGTLGPAKNKRSRGELPLEALDHAEASTAAEALRVLDPSTYRPFNLIVADAHDGYWITLPEIENKIEVQTLPEGLSMITAHDLNDPTHSARQRTHYPRFAAAQTPDPDSGDWSQWENLLESRQRADDNSPESAMLIETDTGFGTSSSSLIAIPSFKKKSENPETSAIWRFRGGKPKEVPWTNIKI